MPKTINSFIKKTSIIASAVGAGVLAGLMLAPKSGKETQKNIKNKMEETKDNIEKKVEHLKKDLKKKVTK